MMNDASKYFELSLASLRAIGGWTADCSARALPVYELHTAADSRPRAALEGIREFAGGGKRSARLRSLAMAAHAAAREIGDPAAAAAAPSPMQFTTSLPCERHYARSRFLIALWRRSLRTRGRGRPSKRRAWTRGEITMTLSRATGCGHAMAAARDLRGAALHAAYAAGQAAWVPHVAAHELGAAAYAIKAVQAAVPTKERTAAGRRECQWQRAQLLAAIRDLVLDDQRLHNDICWSVFDC